MPSFFFLSQGIQVVLVFLVAFLGREADQRLAAAEKSHVVLAIVVFEPADDGDALFRAKLADLFQLVVRYARRNDQEFWVGLAKAIVLIDGRKSPVI